MSEIAPPEARRSVAGFQEGVRGVIPPMNPERRRSFLSDVITELGFADEAIVEQAVEEARKPGRTVGGLLIAGGAIDEEQLAQATAERSGLDYVDLADFEVDFGAAGLITPSAARRYTAVPIAFAGDDALIVAFEDPTDALAISDIEVMTKSEVRRVVASPDAIVELIERLPGADRVPGAAKAAPVEVEPMDVEPIEVEPEAPVEAPEPPPVEPPADVTLNEVPEIEEPRVAPEPPSGPSPEEQVRSQLAEAEQERLRSELAAAEDEQARLREQLAEGEGEQERLRAQLAEAEAEAERARDEAENANSGRDLIRNEAMRLAKELKRFESAQG